MVGCDGDFKLTGGTGRFAGVTGGGRILIRSEQRQITKTSSVSVQEQGIGILVLRELQYKIP
jgi:hypothetical protein